MTPPAAASSRALLRRLEDDPCQLSRKKNKQQRDVKVDDSLNPPCFHFMAQKFPESSDSN